MPWNAESEVWLKKKQLWPQEGEHPDWGFSVKMSTQPVWDWTVRASRIPPDAVWLGLRVHRVIGWLVTLYTRDKRYQVQWRASGASVESEQLRFRKMTAWPAMTDLDDFPALIPALERLLSIRFQVRATVEVPALTGEQVERLGLWLKPGCKEVDLQVHRLDGLISPSLAKWVVPEDMAPPGYRFVLHTDALEPWSTPE